ncbi:hypothetical protein [Peribacillus asahii]|uniref:hypothetical protein n=1 Tax=Peribacillus asahii TaxID=228899 RepID=UPI00381B845D
MFHTDCEKEFGNKLISDSLEVFSIKHSVSMKGFPNDNAVANAHEEYSKTEFAKEVHFTNLEQLTLELDDYVR